MRIVGLWDGNGHNIDFKTHSNHFLSFWDELRIVFLKTAIFNVYLALPSLGLLSQFGPETPQAGTPYYSYTVLQNLQKLWQWHHSYKVLLLVHYHQCTCFQNSALCTKRGDHHWGGRNKNCVYHLIVCNANKSQVIKAKQLSNARLGDTSVWRWATTDHHHHLNHSECLQAISHHMLRSFNSFKGTRCNKTSG